STPFIPSPPVATKRRTMSQEEGQNYTPIPLTTGSIFHAETQTARRTRATVSELEAAVTQLAEIVLAYGAKYAPLMLAIEQELELARKEEDPMERARRILETYRSGGGLKAIRESQSAA
ncbi:MAG: hypothetical protein AB1592_13790, partial [Pseudomonadota bacterium]